MALGHRIMNDTINMLLRMILYITQEAILRARHTAKIMSTLRNIIVPCTLIHMYKQ